MGSSTNKGNISGLLFTLCWICLAILVIILGRIMLTDSVKSGQYNNPKVATTVIGGTIYDKNKRVLAMDVPKYDVYVDPTYYDLDLLAQVLSLHLNLTPDDIKAKLASEDNLILLMENLTEQTVENLNKDISTNNLTEFVYIKKSYIRTYPAQFHASQLISLIENYYEELLFPQAEYDTNVTYGKDLVLTLDLDVQYLLDLAVQNIYQLQSPEFVIAQLVDVSSQQIVAASYYPFWDLNQGSNETTHSTLLGSFSYNEISVENLQVIKEVLNHNTSTSFETELDASALYTSNKNILALKQKVNGTTSTIAMLGDKYLVFIASSEAKYYTNSSVLDDALKALIEGLTSQNKL